MQTKGRRGSPGYFFSVDLRPSPYVCLMPPAAWQAHQHSLHQNRCMQVEKKQPKIGSRFWGNGCGRAGNPWLKRHGLHTSPCDSWNTSRSLPHQYISSGALSSNGEISKMGRNNRIFIPLIHIQFFSPPPIASLSSAHAYELRLYLSFKWVVLLFTISFL